MTSRPSRLALVAAALVLGAMSYVAIRAVACPFCAAVALTFSEEIGNSQVALVAKLVKAPERATGDAAANASAEVAKSKFEIVKVLKGADALGKITTVETVYFGDNKPGTL